MTDGESANQPSVELCSVVTERLSLVAVVCVGVATSDARRYGGRLITTQSVSRRVRQSTRMETG